MYKRQVTKSGKIGIIGTEGTVSSGAYEKAIYGIDHGVKMVLRACPLFVPIAEEGWQDTDIALLAAQKYLSDLKESGIDALVMACTHYPLLEKTIGKVLGHDIKLVNPAYETAKVLEYMINSNGLKNERPHVAEYKYLSLIHI